uniref:Natural killer cell receptor 2B4 immunoglobulin domain-containing protein n=1 Tax=Aquila chrysaetos chrysaetos TaxID=223781 RepID=A0A663DPB3_AQUCH
GLQPSLLRAGQRLLREHLQCMARAAAAVRHTTNLGWCRKPPQGWTKVTWRVRLDAGYQQRILTVEKNKADLFSNSTFFGRAVFQQETFSLQISPVSTADSGVYEAEFEDTSGTLTTRCFQPVHSLHLETHVLDREQGWCNLSLVCTVSGAGNVSYSWSCSGDPRGALEHQSWLHLEVHGDAGPTICRCNVSNPVSWSTDSTNITVASCQAVASVAVSLGLALAISIALIVTCNWRRKRAKDPLLVGWAAMGFWLCSPCSPPDCCDTPNALCAGPGVLLLQSWGWCLISHWALSPPCQVLHKA